MNDQETGANGAAVDADELDAALAEAENASCTYRHVFKRPFTYNGKAYTELVFDFDKLTGRDGLNIETELQAFGITVIVPALSGPYLVRMAAKACTEKIGSDAFEYMRLFDYEKIRSAARSFLLAAE